MEAIRVGEVYKLHGIASLAIPEDTPVEEVISRFAKDPGIRGIFLVDSIGRFTGEVTRIHLLKWLRLRLYGTSAMRKSHGRGGIGKGISAWEVSRLVSATKAKDLSRADWWSLSVREDDNLQTALDKMVEQETTILPVLDRQGKILGDLRLSEVLLKAIEHGRQSNTAPRTE